MSLCHCGGSGHSGHGGQRAHPDGRSHQQAHPLLQCQRAPQDGGSLRQVSPQAT